MVGEKILHQFAINQSSNLPEQSRVEVPNMDILDIWSVHMAKNQIFG